MTTKRPLPLVDCNSDVYWNKAKEKKLFVQHCKTTDQYFLYSKQLVSNIDESNLEWLEVSGRGTIYSYTIVYTPAGEFFKEDIPYIVGSILLEEGARIISNIFCRDPKGIFIGQEVKVMFKNFDNNLTVPVFKTLDY